MAESAGKGIAALKVRFNRRQLLRLSAARCCEGREEPTRVRDAGGAIAYVSLEQLVPYSKEKGRLAKATAPQIAPPPEEKAPDAVVPIEDIRLNLNAATAEQISKRLPGVGYATAKKIVELRMSLSGERFNNLKQL